MPFTIKTTDKPGKEELRKKLGPAHLDYLDRQMDILLAAGALLTDDGSMRRAGSSSSMSRSALPPSASSTTIPSPRDGLFAGITIERWRTAYFDKKRFI